MFELLAEGVSSALLPCSLTVALPALAVALAARTESTSGLLGYAASLLGFSWLRFSDRAEELDRFTIAGMIAVGAAVLVLPLIRRFDVISALGGFLVGIAAAALWEPCVGAEFGGLLNDLPTRGGTGLALMALYTTGVMAPMIALGAAMHYLPEALTLPIRPAMLFVGVGSLTILAVGVAAGYHDELLGELVRLST